MLGKEHVRRPHAFREPIEALGGRYAAVVALHPLEVSASQIPRHDGELVADRRESISKGRLRSAITGCASPARRRRKGAGKKE
jgi:hypothetical protein